MKEEKDLERLFQERFKDFETSPVRDLWPGISHRIGASEKRRKPLLAWYRLVGAAAVIAFAFLGTLSYLNLPWTDGPPNPSVTSTPASETFNSDPVSGAKTSAEKSGIRFTPENLTPGKEGVNTTLKVVTANPKNNNTAPETNLVTTEKRNQTQPVTVLNTRTHKITGFTPNTILTGTVLYPQYLMETTALSGLSSIPGTTDPKEKEPAPHSLNRWTFNPSVAPVYYNTLRNGSPIEQSFDDNYKTGETHLSYGLHVAYQVAKNLSIRTGMNKVTMGYSTDDVTFSTNSGNPIATGNIDYSGNHLNLIISNLSQRPQRAFLPEVPKTGVLYNGSMIQRMGYLEVPFEVKYKMTGDRLGLHFIGGVSSLFLLDNQILLQSSTIYTEVGEANNINSMNFSTNLGLGVDYRLTNDLMFNLEPMFKYQWNTFSGDDGGFSPYLLGIYTGFSFRF